MAENRDFELSSETRDKGTLVARVPAVLHQYWDQGSMPKDAWGWTIHAAQVAERLGWRYRLWSRDDCWGLPGFDELFPKCRTVSQVSNLARYCLLLECGGLYLDADMDVDALPFVIHGAWIAGLPGSDRVNPAQFAAPPGHPYVRRILDRLRFDDAWPASDRSGPDVCTAALGVAADVHVWRAMWWCHHHFRRDRWNSARPK